MYYNFFFPEIQCAPYYMSLPPLIASSWFVYFMYTYPLHKSECQVTLLLLDTFVMVLTAMSFFFRP